MHVDDEEGGGEESDGGDIGGCDCGGMMEEEEKEKEDEVVKRRAISFKHEQLKRRNPSEHEMHETSPSENRSGMHYVTCTCGFSYGYDTSD